MVDRADKASWRGIPCAPGWATGPAHVVPRRRGAQPGAADEGREDDGSSRETRELTRLRAAVAAVAASLGETHALLDTGSLSDAGPMIHALVTSHRAVLDDPVFVGTAEAEIARAGVSAEVAIDRSLTALRARFDAVQRAEFRTWFRDVEGLAEEIRAQLDSPLPRRRIDCAPGAVVVADRVTLSEVIGLLRCDAAGLLLAGASLTSHIAVLCRSAGLPAVAGLRDIDQRVAHGALLTMDGTTGAVYEGAAVATAEPTPDSDGAAPARRSGAARAMTLRANLDVHLDASWAHAKGTHGVGLWRTFYLYLGRTELPSEDELTALFSQVLRDFDPEPVTIRLLDLSGPFEREELPRALQGLGACRGIRLRETRPAVLRTQLRALVRAAPAGVLRILIPFVSTPEEVVWVRACMAEAQQALNLRDPIPIGAMIEVPAALLLLDELAQCSDFFAIGSNDLSALLLGQPRDPSARCDRAASAHARPLILRAIRSIVAAAARAEIDVSLCGELASTPSAAADLVASGLRELSLSPRLAPAMLRALQQLPRV